jgi:hypothetical protein
MSIALLLLQAILCLALLHREVVLNHCRHLATSLFFLVYLLVYIAEPLILHLGFDGARSITVGATELFTDSAVYLVFNMIGITLLACALALSLLRAPLQAPQDLAVTAAHADWVHVANALGLMMVLGVAAFVQGAGMSLEELLTAGRFAWVDSGAFNVAYVVLASYLLALSSVYIYLLLAHPQSSRWIAVAAFGALVLYGVVTKDRKWIFFLLSGWVAVRYYRAGGRLVLGWKAGTAMAGIFLLVLLSQFLRDAIPRFLLDDDFEVQDQLYGSLSYLFEYSDLSYFYRATLEAIHQHLNNDFQVTLALVRRTLFFFVPTGLTGGLKVEDISATFSDVVGGEDALRRGNMPPGLFGLFVVSFGWAWSAWLMPFVAWGLARLDAVLAGPPSALRVCLATSAITSTVFAFRGDESTAFYFPAVNLLVVGTLLALHRQLHSPVPHGASAAPTKL